MKDIKKEIQDLVELLLTNSLIDIELYLTPDDMASIGYSVINVFRKWEREDGVSHDEDLSEKCLQIKELIERRLTVSIEEAVADDAVVVNERASNGR